MSKTISAENSGKKNSEKIRKLTLAAMLTAIVVVLALLGTSIRIGIFSINLSLVPIVVGAALLGPWFGGWFGLVNAVVILLSGDANLFFMFNPAGTVVTVLLKGVLSGLAAGAVYKLLAPKNKYAAVLLAAIICPVVNTGVFVLGCYVFFWDYLPKIAELLKVPLESRSAFIFTVLVGWNFPLEVAVNVILAPVIARILGFSEDKNVSKIVYGSVLAVLGLGFTIFAVVLLSRALVGVNPQAVAKPVVRYIVMLSFSALVMAGGAALAIVGAVRKKRDAAARK